MGILTRILSKIDNKYFSYDDVKLSNEDNEVFYNYNYYNQKLNKKALLSYVSEPFFKSQEPSLFNPYGTSITIARVLNELGYEVDIINLWDVGYKIRKDYDLFFGHCNFNFKEISKQLSKKTVKIFYINTAPYNSFDSQSEKRYSRFIKSRNINNNINFKRIQNSDYDSFKIADKIISLGKRTTELIEEEFQNKTFYINNAIYPINYKKQPIQIKNNSNFIFQSGTSGNIQKGTDIVIEAFSKLINQHLFIDCKLEADILKYYSKELKRKNIHYIYYARKNKWLRKQFYKNINFSIGTGILTGQNTAFISSLHYGFVPIMTESMDININEKKLFFKSEKIDDLVFKIKEVSNYKEDEMERLNKIVNDFTMKNHTISNFSKMMKKAIEISY